MSTLHEITGDMLRLLSLADELDDEQALKDTMDAMQGEFKDKADGYGRVLTELISEAERIDFEVNRLKERRDRLRKNAERIHDNLKYSMIVTGNVDFKTDLYTFKIQKNPPKVVVTDESIIPDEFFNEKVTVTKALDKTALKEALKVVDIDGAHLEREEKLVIK